MNARPHTPLIVVIGGHDPSGAGIQADIETALARGCHAASLITCLTTQNTERVTEVIPTAGATLVAQFDLLTQDWATFDACKIGLIPTVEVARAIVHIVRRLPVGTPIVLDPVIAAGSGAELRGHDVRRVVLEELWPLATVRTPNAQEAARLATLAGHRDTATWRRAQRGWLLVKSVTSTATTLAHELDADGERQMSSSWPTLPGRFHGTGCTLATAIACGLARGDAMATACASALDYTWHTLLDPLDFRGAQQLPRRLSAGTE